jgi:hypothetical protein
MVTYQNGFYKYFWNRRVSGYIPGLIIIVDMSFILRTAQQRKNMNLFFLIHQVFALKKINFYLYKRILQGKNMAQIGKVPQKNSKSLEFNVKFQEVAKNIEGT